MPTPSVGKVVQYVPSQAVDNINGTDYNQIQAGIITHVNPVCLKVFGDDGRDFLISNAIEDDTQTTPNSWTYANQTS